MHNEMQSSITSRAMIRRSAVCLFAWFAFGSLAIGAEPAKMSAEEAIPKITPAQMREDLVFLRDVWAKQDQSFNPAQAHAFHRLVADTIAQADRLDAVAFWVQVSRAVALSGNGHTNINADTPPFAGLPIEVWWFRDGLYIVAAEPSHAELLGARIEKFG